VTPIMLAANELGFREQRLVFSAGASNSLVTIAYHGPAVWTPAVCQRYHEDWVRT
jgi:hypothetical protein